MSSPNNRYDQKITVYDMFTFETRMREIVSDALQPVLNTAEQDHRRVVSTHLTVQDLQTRLRTVEQFARIKSPLQQNSSSDFPKKTKFDEVEDKIS